MELAYGNNEMSLNCLCLIYQEARVLLFDLPILMLQNSDAKLVLNYSIQTGQAFYLEFMRDWVIWLFSYICFLCGFEFLRAHKNHVLIQIWLSSLSLYLQLQHLASEEKKKKSKGDTFLSMFFESSLFSRFHTYIGHIICKPLHLLLKIDICLQAFNCTVR